MRGGGIKVLTIPCDFAQTRIWAVARNATDIHFSPFLWPLTSLKQTAHCLLECATKVEELLMSINNN